MKINVGSCQQLQGGFMRDPPRDLDATRDELLSERTIAVTNPKKARAAPRGHGLRNVREERRVFLRSESPDSHHNRIVGICGRASGARKARWQLCPAAYSPV